jgi:hypothetical protein
MLASALSSAPLALSTIAARQKEMSFTPHNLEDTLFLRKALKPHIGQMLKSSVILAAVKHSAPEIGDAIQWLHPSATA